MLLVAILETGRLGGFDPLDPAGVAVPLVVGLRLALATHTSELNIHALTGCFTLPEVFSPSAHSARKIIIIKKKCLGNGIESCGSVTLDPAATERAALGADGLMRLPGWISLQSRIFSPSFAAGVITGQAPQGC